MYEGQSPDKKLKGRYDENGLFVVEDSLLEIDEEY